MKINLASLLIIITFSLSAQTDQENYNNAYEKLNNMLNDSIELSFKKAVFTVENAYFSNKIDEKIFDKNIKLLTGLSNNLITSRDLIYDLEDKEQVEKYASLFTVMKDTIPIQLDSTNIVFLPPYSYDFNDIWGNNEWSNMFVIKLLDTRKGNCHSLPYLYKILAEEIGADAHIAVAPNHFYIKHKSKANGWYNTELTSGIFPNDAWLMASGYIHLDAIVNKLYMEALDDKQSISLCMIDLAKGYERKMEYEANTDFMMKCCDTALEFYPNYINALLLKAEIKKKQYEILMYDHLANKPEDILYMHDAKKLHKEMTNLYTQIHNLGYRRMPKNMYLNWLVSLKEQRGKYENKNISNFKTNSK